MRREEVINLGAEDIRLEENQILIHSRVKGGNYEWRESNQTKSIRRIFWNGSDI